MRKNYSSNRGLRVDIEEIRKSFDCSQTITGGPGARITIGEAPAHVCHATALIDGKQLKSLVQPPKQDLSAVRMLYQVSSAITGDDGCFAGEFLVEFELLSQFDGLSASMGYL